MAGEANRRLVQPLLTVVNGKDPFLQGLWRRFCIPTVSFAEGSVLPGPQGCQDPNAVDLPMLFDLLNDRVLFKGAAVCRVSQEEITGHSGCEWLRDSA